ncbi:MAG TPA: UvrD-helicase domain-containing protein [Pirellulales bacterium]|nr:UvrD-helicase domain-containing protein [Pirellulales bacterium]
MTASSTRFPHTLIRASAGTGKTFQLSNRYLGLAAAGESPDEILATTFTRKAAGEILERVLTRLAHAAVDRDQAVELARFIGDANFSSSHAQQVLEGLVHQLHRLRISTLDAFFAQLARSFDLELGLAPGWRIVEESTDTRLRNDAAQAVLAAGDVRDTLTLLHLLTKGDATRSVNEQLQSLVNDLYALYQQTSVAAWEAIERSPRLPDEKLAAAIDALSQCELPKDKRFAAARDKDLAAARAGDWATFIENGLANKVLCAEETYYGKPIEDSLAEVYKALLRHAKGVLVGQLVDRNHAARQFLEKFDAQYTRLKLAQRALRFDDITLALGKSGLLEHKRRLAFRLDTLINHVLFDEFQDTSLEQWKVLRPLVENVMREGAAASFFCVGDAKQAIYGWRGGVAELFDSLSNDWPGLAQPVLACSRRSAQPIVDTVNRVFEHLHTNPVLADFSAATTEWRRGYQSHTTAQQDLAGYARMVTAPAGETTDEQKAKSLQFAAQEIARLVHETPGKSVGVLVRNNDAIATLIQALGRDGISASEEGGNPLTDSPAVLIILSLLALADHPGDTAARFHVAHSPLGRTLGLDDHENDRQAERISHEVRERLLTWGYGKTLYRWARELAEDSGPRDASRLLQLVELAYRYEPDAGLRTRDFINFVENQHVEAPSPADVRVMTIHKSKGLEFDIVVLPQLDVGLCGQAPPVLVGRPDPVAPADLICRYPNEALRRLLPERVREAYDRYSQQELRESLCVLYVAMTRAIHALHIIVSPSRSGDKRCTFSGLLRAALTEGKPLPESSVVYEHGNPTWAGVGKVAETRQPAAETWPRRSSFQVDLAPPAKRRRRGLERESPSARAHATQVDLATLMSLDDGRAVKRGSTFHAWFEQIEWLDEGAPDDAALRRVAATIGASSADTEQWLAQFQAKLQNPWLRDVLSRHNYLTASTAPWAERTEVCADLADRQPTLEVFRERPFAVRLRDTVLSGTFDRLVLVRSQTAIAFSASQPGNVAVKRRTKSARAAVPSTLLAAEVLDYKTDAVTPGDRPAIAKVVERYRPQLAAYREAVSSMFGLSPDRVITRLMLIEADEVVDVV